MTLVKALRGYPTEPQAPCVTAALWEVTPSVLEFGSEKNESSRLVLVIQRSVSEVRHVCLTDRTRTKFCSETKKVCDG